MKKITLISLLVVAALVPTSTVFASTTPCGQPDPITLVVIPCGGNGSPEMVRNGYGVRNADVPHIQPGQTVTDAAGISYLCPAWFSNFCLDVTGTDIYKQGARSLAHQLNQRGVISSPWLYWLSH